MPTTRLVDTVKILAELTKLHKTIQFHARTNRNFDPASTYRWERSGPWTVELEYDDSGTKLEIKVDGATFDEALQTAWARFDTACRKGAAPNALTPPIEHKALPNGATEEISIP